MTHLIASRPFRVAASLVGVAGTFALAGCSATAAEAENAATQSAAASTATTPAASSGAAGYTDGMYTADGSYQTPRSVEKIAVSLTLANGKISEVKVTGNPTQPESKQYQGQFIDGISAEVVGKSIDDLNVTRVSGSSLTSGGFNQAVEAIKKEAMAG